MITLMEAEQAVENSEVVASTANEVVENTTTVAKELINGNTDGLGELMKQTIEWGMDASKSILLALAIYFVGRFVIGMVNRLLAQMLERRKVDASIQSFMKSLVGILLNTLLIITVVGALGVNITTFAALLASLGVAAGMALSGNLQNFAGGLVILLLKPIKVGDYIEAQGNAGTVKEIQIFHTILQTVDNKIIYLPNGALSSGNITNYSKEETRRVDFCFGVEYGTDLEKVTKALQDIITQDERILKDPAPFVRLGELSASSVDMTVRVWVKAADYWDVYFEMREKVYTEFNKQGINFPFPQLQIHQ